MYVAPANQAFGPLEGAHKGALTNEFRQSYGPRSIRTEGRSPRSGRRGGSQLDRWRAAPCACLSTPRTWMTASGSSRCATFVTAALSVRSSPKRWRARSACQCRSGSSRCGCAARSAGTRPPRWWRSQGRGRAKCQRIRTDCESEKSDCAMRKRPISDRSAISPTSSIASCVRDGPSTSRQDDGHDA